MGGGGGASHGATEAHALMDSYGKGSEKLMLVDFDLGGKAGKVPYLSALLNTDLYAVCPLLET